MAVAALRSRCASAQTAGSVASSDQQQMMTQSATHHHAIPTMRSTAILSAVLAASTATQALLIVPEHSANTTVTLAPPLPIKPSGAPIPSGNATATGLPPVPTAPSPGSSGVPIAGAAMNAQNSLLAMGVAIVVAVLTL
ncbi:hypothetical protein E4U57_007794 [Claviceps arundinis]|uniref:Uncharacterized protein n=1 Tax=Claviceps arundinis TaxID=1623583 RepID=A0ABQ7PGB3_9HYPO|nr:hypothetical protein E4U57_007794 [Claviceps arundinis]